MNWSTFGSGSCRHMWKTYKRNSQGQSFDDFFSDWRKELVAANDSSIQSAWKNSPCSCGATQCAHTNSPGGTVFDYCHDALKQMRFTGLPHYFVDCGVADFSRRSVKDFKPEYRDNSLFGSPFMVHFDVRSYPHSLLVSPASNGDWLCTVLGLPHHEVFAINSGPCDFASDVDWASADYATQLLFGLSLYMRAFPECVSEMQTEPMPWMQGPRRMIGRNPIIDEEESRAVSPHFRRGHFRVLQSERYHEPGKVVFVKGTFVKGRAYRVEAAPESQRLLCA